MVGTFTIDANLLKRQTVIPYKYVVYSPIMKGGGPCYEYLHDHGYYGVVNRCLFVASADYDQRYGGLCLYILFGR